MRVSALAPNGKQCWLEDVGNMARIYCDGLVFERCLTPDAISEARRIMWQTKDKVEDFYWIICDGAEMKEAA